MGNPCPKCGGTNTTQLLFRVVCDDCNPPDNQSGTHAEETEGEIASYNVSSDAVVGNITKEEIMSSLAHYMACSELELIGELGRHNCVIAGGAIRDIYRRKIHNEDLHPKDIDIFFGTRNMLQEDRDACARAFMEKLSGGGPLRYAEIDSTEDKCGLTQTISYLPQSIFNSGSREAPKIQLIFFHDFDRPEQLLETFDFTINQAAIGVEIHGGKSLIVQYFIEGQQRGVLDDIKHKRLRLSPQGSMNSSIKRMVSFSYRGWFMDDSEIEKFCQVNNIKTKKIIGTKNTGYKP